MNSTVIFPDYTFYSINLLPFWYVWADSIMLFFTFHNIRHYVSLEKKLTKNWTMSINYLESIFIWKILLFTHCCTSMYVFIGNIWALQKSLLIHEMILQRWYAFISAIFFARFTLLRSKHLPKKFCWKNIIYSVKW